MFGKATADFARASSSHAPSSSPPPRASHASAPRRMPLPCAPSESPLRTHACSCGPPRPRTFGVCRALVVSARTHKTAEVSPGPFSHSEQTTWHGQLLGLRFPVSRLCAVVVSVLLERGVFFEFISTVSRKTVLSPGTTPKQFFDSQNPAWHLEPRRF